MKNLFFVSVAIGIFSGTSLTAKAQPSVNIERLNASIQVKKSTNVIDGYELKSSDLSTTDVKSSNVLSIEKASSIQFKYALLLDLDVEEIKNMTLYEDIEKWWATRYRYGGTSEKGIDCSAYTGTLLSDVYGINLPRTAMAQYAESERIERDDLQEGDLVFFNTGRGISHVGLYLGNGYFTHSGSSTGVTISHLDETYWSRKYRGGGRIVPAVSE